jgi:hypothetical protein
MCIEPETVRDIFLSVRRSVAFFFGHNTLRNISLWDRVNWTRGLIEKFIHDESWSSARL